MHENHFGNGWVISVVGCQTYGQQQRDDDDDPLSCSTLARDLRHYPYDVLEHPLAASPDNSVGLLAVLVGN